MTLSPFRPRTDAEILAGIAQWEQRHPRLNRALNALFSPVDAFIKWWRSRGCLLHAWEPLFPCDKGCDYNEWWALPEYERQLEVCPFCLQVAIRYECDFPFRHVRRRLTELASFEWARAYAWRKTGRASALPGVLGQPGVSWSIAPPLEERRRAAGGFE